MPGARFVGIGVSEYDDPGFRALGNAVADVEAVAGLLGASFECTLLPNPNKRSATDLLASLPRTMPDGGSLVLFWSGHAITSRNGGLRLLARDAHEGVPSDGLTTADIVDPCIETGADQLLLIVDTCFSGRALKPADVAARFMEPVPERQHGWIGMLSSCLSVEKARDGVFGQRLIGLLETGPLPDPQVGGLLVRRWSAQNEFISGYDLCDALLKTWDTQAHTPVFLNSGDARWMFRNPRYDAGAPEQVVEHLLLAARGGPGERSWFTGRVLEVSRVVGWVRSRQPGVYVVTGSAGTGKTTIIGRVLILSNSAERARLIAKWPALEHADPGEGSVAAHVHARGLTADRAADLLARDLVRAGVLIAQDEPRNAAELVGQVQRAVEQGASPPVILVDGLDEARAHTFAIAEELLLRLAPFAVVIVSTRERPRDGTGQSLLGMLMAVGAAELDLDAPATRERGRSDMRAYITGRLTGVSAAMDPAAIAAHLSAASASPFLLASMVTDHLRTFPIDTSQPGWYDHVSHSVEDAFDADLRRVSADQTARILLTALTWGLGAGFPEEEWLACANALGDGGFGSADVSWVLDELGRYIVQDGEAGVAVYRMAHQSLADHIRQPFVPSYQEVFDPHSRFLAVALLGRYEMLLDGGMEATGPGYLSRYVWRHVAAAGPAGLELLRDLASRHGVLWGLVALTDREVADQLMNWGSSAAAVAPAEEAVALCRRLNDASPTWREHLALVLNDLGGIYEAAGQLDRALAAAEESAQIYSGLAAGNLALRADLAMALSNLGIRYRALARYDEALAFTEQGTQIYREIAAGNPIVQPNLANALTNLGGFYSKLGRHDDAFACAEESVRICRQLATGNPAARRNLAGALMNLGTYYGAAGRRDEALTLTEESVGLCRELADGNLASRHDLAKALTNLGLRYGALGRSGEAMTATEESAQILGKLAPVDPAARTDYAFTLDVLGSRLAEVGQYRDAVARAEESVRIYREAVARRPILQPDLAGALINLGTWYVEVGRYPDALRVGEESVRLYQELANGGHPEVLPGFAHALFTLGTYCGKLGRIPEALACTEGSIYLYQDLAAHEPAVRPDFAIALQNLGLLYAKVGRDDDALAITEESVHLLRELTDSKLTPRSNLAAVLTNLSVRYHEAGRYQEALETTGQAVRIYRGLADNPAVRPNLAVALTNLANFYGELGRYQDALAPAEESVRIYQTLVADNPALRPGYVSALNNLGKAYGQLHQYQEALARTEDAVRLSRELAAEAPGFRDLLVTTLIGLTYHCREAGIPDRGEAAWEQATNEAQPAAAARLLVARAAKAETGYPAAANWLLRALTLDDDRSLHAAVHVIARHHRGQDPDAFDRNWAQLTSQPVPDWLTVDPASLGIALAWIGTDTFQAERDYLAAHPELLDPDSDAAVAEALLTMSEDDEHGHAAVRQAARQDGIEAAYRPLLLSILAQEFAFASPDEQRELLDGHREDLRSDTVAGVLDELSGEEGDAAIVAQRAAALIALDRTADAKPVFAALAEPGQFGPLLHALAIGASTSSLIPAATVAYTTATTSAQAATAGFYLAVGEAVKGDHDQAADLMAEASEVGPDQVRPWINELAEIGRHHPGVLTLIPVLTALQVPGDNE